MRKSFLLSSVATFAAETGGGNGNNISAITRQGMKFGSKANANTDEAKAFTAHITEAVDAKEVTARGPFNAYIDMMALHGPEEFASFPAPDTDRDPESDKYSGNEPADKYKGTTPDGKNVVYSFWNDYAATTIPGAAAEKAIVQIDVTVANYATDKAKTEGGPYGNATEWTLPDLKAERKRLEQRRNAVRALVKKAKNIEIRLREIAGMPKVMNEKTGQMVDPVIVSWSQNKDGTLRATTVPIIVTDGSDMPASVQRFKPMGAATFIGLNVKKAIANGGTWDALINSGGRETEDDDADKTDNGGLTVDAPVEKIVSAVSIMGHWFDKAENKAKLLRQINGKDKDKSNEAIQMIGDLVTLLADYYTPAVKARYLALNEMPDDTAKAS